MIVLAILLMIMPLRNTNELLSTINRSPFPRAVRIWFASVWSSGGYLVTT